MLHPAGHGSEQVTEHSIGGLVEMDERGHPFRSGSANDSQIEDKRIYPYSVVALPEFDRAISTTTDMDHADTTQTSQWVQIWRLSDLKLLRSIAVQPGPRGDENQLTGEPQVLCDGRSVYIHTFNCGLYLLRGIDRPEPTVAFVAAFEGKGCGVPIVTGHCWLQTVPDAHALIALDIVNPDQPRETSRVVIGDDESPHWIRSIPRSRWRHGQQQGMSSSGLARRGSGIGDRGSDGRTGGPAGPPRHGARPGHYLSVPFSCTHEPHHGGLHEAGGLVRHGYATMPHLRALCRAGPFGPAGRICI